jgi:SdpI/YfhL protein family
MTVLTSYVAFPLIGLASLVLGWPLARRRVPPNRWYGVRLSATMANPAIWYEANAVCGDELVRLGLVLCTVAIGLRFVRGLPELGYVVICLAVFVVGSLRATVRSVRVARRLSKSGGYRSLSSIRAASIAARSPRVRPRTAVVICG